MKMKLSVTPKKSLGQNFLINSQVLDKIVEAAEVSKSDVILEIGPGTGNLTEKLTEKTQKVITIEKDRRLIEPLQEKFKDTNVKVIEADVLKFRIENLKFDDFDYKIIGNIPYYITSRFLRKIFTEWPKPQLVVLTIQKEVAQRIIAKPPHMNLLAVSIQFFAEPKIISYISKENFRPRPKVDSALLRIKLRRAQQSKEFTEKFFKIVKTGFSQKRKLLISNLEKLGFNKKELAENFKKLGISPESRAENLTIDQWIELSKILTIK